MGAGCNIFGRKESRNRGQKYTSYRTRLYLLTYHHSGMSDVVHYFFNFPRLTRGLVTVYDMMKVPKIIIETRIIPQVSLTPDQNPIPPKLFLLSPPPSTLHNKKEKLSFSRSPRNYPVARTEPLPVSPNFTPSRRRLALDNKIPAAGCGAQKSCRLRRREEKERKKGEKNSARRAMVSRSLAAEVCRLATFPFARGEREELSNVTSARRRERAAGCTSYYSTFSGTVLARMQCAVLHLSSCRCRGVGIHCASQCARERISAQRNIAEFSRGRLHALMGGSDPGNRAHELCVIMECAFVRPDDCLGRARCVCAVLSLR